MAKENKVISADDFVSDIPVKTENTETVKPTSTETVEPTEEVKKVKRTGSETEIREVDPTKNKKLQKRMAQKSTPLDKIKFKIPKKLLYVIVPVLLIVILIVIKLISDRAGGLGNTNYFTILDTIIQNEQGQFTYTIDVRTRAIEPVNTQNETGADYNEVANTESGTDVPEELQEQPVMKNQFTESWGSADDIKVFSWQYPQYKIIIDGVCFNSNPEAYEADIKVSLATVGHNDLITEILVKDGKYYIDFNSLGVWLRSSKDAYLISLGEDIPEGAKYVVINQEDFKIPSRYAEDYELENSSIVGLRDNIRTLNALIAYLESNIKDCIGKECYSTSTSEGGTTERLTIGVNTGNKITEKVKSLALNSSAAYDGYVEVLKNNGLLTETQYQQKLNEKDNFLYAINPLQIYFNTKPIDMTNLQALGSARQYTSSSNQNVAEADLHVQFQSDDKSYDIMASLTRKSGKVAPIEIDKSNIIDIHKLVADETIDGRTYLLGKFNRLIDYLNPSCIQLSKQLEMNPERISENIKQSLVSIVNSMPEQTGVYLTTLTVDKYIETYKNLIDKKDELTGTDKVNTLIVEDFLNTVNDITGGVIIEVPVEAEVEQIVYPELIYEDSDMKIIANFNQELSNKNVYVVSTTIMNKTSNPVTLNLTNFSLRTLLSSTYSSNNLTTLKDNDNTWDETLTPQAIELNASSYADVDLYFVVAGDSGYMDMWYQPIDKDAIKLGVIVQE